MQCLFRHQGLGAVFHLALRAQQKLPQRDLHLRFHGFRIRARLEASNQVEPIEGGIIQQGIGGFKQRLGCQRDPERGRVALNAVAKEPGRSDAHDCDRLRIDDEISAYDRAVSAEFLLPGAETHHRYGGRAGNVVL